MPPASTVAPETPLRTATVRATHWRLWLLRLSLWALGIVPLAQLVYQAYNAQLGANPVEFIEHALGEWTLRLLLLTLAMTPLRRLTGWTEWIAVRRLVGLWTFLYLCLHFTAYVVFDLGFSLAQLSEDIVKRTYITLGFAAWLMLLPLAITSTKGMQRRLKRTWKKLHRLIYPAAILGALHYLWLVKADIREPLVYLCLLGLLLILRIPGLRLEGLRTAFKRSPQIS